MSKAFDRTVTLIGAENFAKISSAKILIAGLGGVGGAVVETLARSGVGEFTLVDFDVFEQSNLNRQILCTIGEIGKNKTDVARTRILSINPDAVVDVVNERITAENVDKIISKDFTYCIDAIDDIKAKTALIVACKERNIPIISAMGAGNRIDCDFEVTDLFKTQNDPLARVMRRELRNKINSLDVVCAKTPPLIKSEIPMSFVAPPNVMGIMLANYAIKNLMLL